ncbi:MAG: dihydropteroate synthase [Candidatus Gastranaerophilales bacterium]|nr:dihydropteroate synthase [Candidatus Gastranaerophilales bacterium]
MKIISENIHIISKSIKEAVLVRDEAFIRSIVQRQIDTNPDFIDLNIGPAKKAFSGTMTWLVNIVRSMSEVPLSFDSTNQEEIRAGLSLVKNPSACIINSTSADEQRLEAVTSLAKEFDSNIIALTLNNEIGIPKMADERLELAFSIIEKTSEKEIDNSKIFFDPLILPIAVDQSQAGQALDAIRMFKESFDPPVLTTIGLSNVSNGCPKELRPLINRVFFVLASGCGLDSAIVDSFDFELLRLNKVLETGICEKSYDKFIIDLFQMQRDFGDLSDLSFDKDDVEAKNIHKTAEILLNKKIYSNSYLEI